MYFPKQHYESIVPEKSGINRFSASHGIDLFIQRHFPHQNSNTTLIYRCRNVIDVTTRQGTKLCRAKSDSARHYRFIVPTRLTNEFPRIYHVMH